MITYSVLVVSGLAILYLCRCVFKLSELNKKLCGQSDAIADEAIRECKSVVAHIAHQRKSFDDIMKTAEDNFELFNEAIANNAEMTHLNMDALKIVKGDLARCQASSDVYRAQVEGLRKEVDAKGKEIDKLRGKIREQATEKAK